MRHVGQAGAGIEQNLLRHIAIAAGGYNLQYGIAHGVDDRDIAGQEMVTYSRVPSAEMAKPLGRAPTGIER